ncbi:MAG TPA: hypothetical protein EYP22_00590 [Methanosarcinales archaeon]|nr:hypothetical protein [Methanosarcinales archaeon]
MKNIKKIMCLLLCVLIIAVTGCTEKNVKVISLKKTQKNEETIHFDNKTIKIAIASVISPKKTYIYYQDLIDYLSKKLGMPIEIVQTSWIAFYCYNYWIYCNIPS